MFLGAVSVAKERQAQSKTAPAAAVPSPAVFTIIPGLDDEELVFLKKSEHHKAKRGENGPLLYGGGTGAPGDLPAPSREIIMSYFQVCSELMLDPESIEHILGQAESTGRALQQVAMEFQREVMEFNFLIEPNAGCTYLSKLTNLTAKRHRHILGCVELLPFTFSDEFTLELSQIIHAAEANSGHRRSGYRAVSPS